MTITINTPILVTGGAGGLGVATVNLLKKNGYQKVFSPSRNELDLLNIKSVQDYFEEKKPVVVIHLACIVFGLLGNQQNQMMSIMDNTIINANLFSGINESDSVRYIFFAGTVASYPYPYAHVPLIETDFFNGLPHGGEFGYAMSKRHAYGYMHILNETKGIKFTYGIFTNLYGENDRFNDGTGHVIPSLIMKAYRAKHENKPFTVWGNGLAERDFLHFDDAAAAIICCMNAESTPELVNISSGQSLTIKRLSEIIANEAGIDSIEFLVDKPVGIPSRVVDNTRLCSLSFSQCVSIEEGIKRTYRWYSDNINNVRT